MESTLTLKKSDFESKVGIFAGWGKGLAAGGEAWADNQADAIRDAVNSGYRQFLFPALPGGMAYDWTFLKPVATLTMAIGDQLMALPDDFGGFEGRLLVSTATSTNWNEIPLVGVGMVYGWDAGQPTRTGKPVGACLEPLKGTTIDRGQRYRLRLWPSPDIAYSVKFRYYLLPDCLSDDYPYAYGGMQHSETILESCLAIFEERQDDASSIHAAKFQTRLSASIASDHRMKPQLLGYNGDDSVALMNGRWGGGRFGQNITVTYNGQSS